MSYRKLNVNGTEYKYVIGSQYTKIVGLGNFKNSEIGTKINKKINDEYVYVVTPSTVRSAITGKPANKVMYCSQHNVTSTKLIADPYMAEIHNETVMIMNCPECVESLADDI